MKIIQYIKNKYYYYRFISFLNKNYISTDTEDSILFDFFSKNGRVGDLR